MRRATLIVLMPVTLLLGAWAAGAPLPGIPSYAQNYKSFPKLNTKPIKNTPTTAHPAGVKNIYISKRAVQGRYPYGTVIVKEGRTGGRINLIAVMRKTRGADPRHNDWKWVEYMPSKGGRFSATASGAVCWTCHQIAKKRDYVFTP